VINYEKQNQVLIKICIFYYKQRSPLHVSAPIVAIFREVFFERYIKWNVEKIHKHKMLNYNLNLIHKLVKCFNILCNIYFKEYLLEDGHSRWPKHVAGYAVYNTINVHIHGMYMHFLSLFLIM
jgi:hypothetical protein